MLRAFALSRAARLGAGCAAAGLAASQTECLGADARRISESCDAVGVDKSPSTGPRPLMEQLTNPPPFGSGASRFDMSTYGGRALHFLNVLGDPTTLWTSAAELEAHRDLLRRHAKGEKTGATDAELWRADKVVTATTRGETGEMVPAPFRFSFFACAAPVGFRVAVRGAPAASAPHVRPRRPRRYANLVICAGLLRPDASLASACVFWRSAAAMSQGRFIDASTARGVGGLLPVAQPVVQRGRQLVQPLLRRGRHPVARHCLRRRHRRRSRHRRRRDGPRQAGGRRHRPADGADVGRCSERRPQPRPHEATPVVRRRLEARLPTAPPSLFPPLPPAAGGRSWTEYLCTPPTGWSSASPRRRESSRSQSAPRCARAVLGTAGATDVPLLSTQRGPAPKTSALGPFSQARILWTFLLLTVTPVLSGGALSALPSAISASPTGAMAVDLGATFACARARRPAVSGVSSHLQTAVDRRHLRLHLALCPARDGCVAAARHGGRLGARGAVPGPEG